MEKILLKCEFTKRNPGVLLCGLIFCVVSFVLWMWCLDEPNIMYVIGAIAGAFVGVTSLTAYSKMKDQSLTVTNLRIYGVIAGKDINIPIDKISYVSIEGDVLSVATSAGTISCNGCINKKDVQQIISDLIAKK